MKPFDFYANGIATATLFYFLLKDGHVVFAFVLFAGITALMLWFEKMMERDAKREGRKS